MSHRHVAINIWAICLLHCLCVLQWLLVPESPRSSWSQRPSPEGKFLILHRVITNYSMHWTVCRVSVNATQPTRYLTDTLLGTGFQSGKVNSTRSVGCPREYCTMCSLSLWVLHCAACPFTHYIVCSVSLCTFRADARCPSKLITVHRVSEHITMWRISERTLHLMQSGYVNIKLRVGSSSEYYTMCIVS